MKKSPKVIFIVNFLLFGALPVSVLVLLRLAMSDQTAFASFDFVERTVGPAVIFLIIGLILAITRKKYDISA